MAALNVQNPEGHFIGWAPGRGPIVAPDGMPWRLDAGSDLVVELHLLHGKETVAVQPTSAVSDRSAAVRVTAGGRDGNEGHRYPGGEQLCDRGRRGVACGRLAVERLPARALSRKEMRAEAALPDGSTKPLLHQALGFSLAAGLPLRRTGAAAARHAPHDALHLRQLGGERGQSQPAAAACHLGAAVQRRDGQSRLQLLASPADRALLVRTFAEREARDNVRGAEIRVKHAPDVHSCCSAAAISKSAAWPTRSQSSRLPSVSGPTRCRPATFWRRTAGGRPHGRRHCAVAGSRQAGAARCAPAVQSRQGARTRTCASRRRSVRAGDRSRSGFAPPHQELGVLLFTHGRVREALPHLQRAVDLAPDSASAHSDLGVCCRGRALRRCATHLRRALELDPAYAPAREEPRAARLGGGSWSWELHAFTVTAPLQPQFSHDSGAMVPPATKASTGSLLERSL